MEVLHFVYLTTLFRHLVVQAGVSITIHPDDAAAFFKNFIWNPQKFTGNSVGKIIIFRKNSQNKDDQYKRILKHLNQ